MDHSNVKPGTCASCHNGSLATGKSTAHIATPASCDSCHKTTAWKPATGAMDHSNVKPGTCATCHNGSLATGKSTAHIATPASCDSCHKTTGWKPATTLVDHSNVLPGTCASCHNGTSATGKNTAHIATTSSCDTCHKTTGWKPATGMNHSNVVKGTCATCHNGTLATGKSSAHISTAASCDTCHQTTAWKPATGNHSNATPGTCATCHNGTLATGKSAAHISTTASCDTCHQKTGWKLPTGTAMDHSNVVKGTCASCHNGTFAAGKTSMHTYTTASCDTCHKSTAWMPTTISTIDFPVEAVFTSLVSKASTYTASASDTAGNSYLLSAHRVPGSEKTDPLVYPAPLNTYTQANTLKKNGNVVSTDNSETFYSLAPFSVFGSLNNLYGASNNMKVSTQLPLPATGRVGASGILYKGRNYINKATLSPDTWFARWSLEPDSASTAWLCLTIKITPANATVTTEEMECFQIDQPGNITGYKANIIESGADINLSGNDVVEFYNTSLDHYFITTDPGEAVAIDSGNAGTAWVRTGNSFKSGGNASVCRFYGSQSPGPNSHFYTGDPGECYDLKQLQASTPDTERRWNFEGLAFVSTPPTIEGTNRTCPTGTTPVYRAYNNGYTRGVDSNHRITSSLAAIQEVVSRGWSDEGIVMCAPN